MGRWVMSRLARIVESGQTLTIVGPSDQRRFDGDSAALARAVLEFLRAPSTDAELRDGLAAQFEGVGDRPELIDALLGHLRASAAVIPHVDAVPLARPLANTRVLLAATGAVASSFTPVLVSALQGAGAEVRVALTAQARRFVSPRALEALTHHPVLTSLWKGKPSSPAPHIEAAEWADLALVAPASATTIARLATGDCSDVVAATVITTTAPKVIAPSMNPKMHDAPAVKRNVQQLRADGFHLVWPSWGLEVAADPGARRALLGPMLPVEALIDIAAALAPKRAARTRPDAAFWDDQYSRGPLGWHSDAIDTDLRDALGEGRGRLLDLGCGLGTVAIAAAQAGFDVTATDISAIALAAAKKRAGELKISFIADDLLHSGLTGPFDVVVDRAVLHTLPAETHDRYVRHLARLLPPRARLVLKVHCDPEQTRRLGTVAFDADGLQKLLAPELKIVSCADSLIAGSKALCVVAVRA